MPKFSGAEKGSGRLMPLAKSQNHAKQGVVGPKGVKSQDAGMTSGKPAISARAKRRPSIRP